MSKKTSRSRYKKIELWKSAGRIRFLKQFSL